MKHEDCWAKTTVTGRPGVSVEQHCRTAGIVAGVIAAQCPTWLIETVGMRTGVVLAALHDIGKVSPGFQRQCVAWSSEHGLGNVPSAGAEVDHAKISQRTVQDLLGQDSLRHWAAVVGAHHGRLKGVRLPVVGDGVNWVRERHRLAEALVHEFGPLPVKPVADPDCGALWFNAGFIAVADWLASDERYFPPSEILGAPAIRERAKRQLDQIGFRPVTCACDKRFGDLFQFQPNALQAVLAKSVRKPGVYVVESAMGSGKTEAALMAAYNLLAGGQATGIYFALPTQTTSNRIHRRVADFVERLAPGAGTRLVHGNSWLHDVAPSLGGCQEGNAKDREGRHDGRDWFASSRRALLAPFGVGTVDQALLGVVSAKHFFVRQYALAGKVVILDEVHSYDLYTGTLLDRLVARLRDLGATVIVLSATLTAARRRQLLGLSDGALEASAAYPLLSANLGAGGSGGSEVCQFAVPPDPPRTVHVRFMPGDDLVDACLDRANRGECVLWIRNTVNDAQETYRHLCGRNHEGGPEIALLHARFPLFRREALENEWLERLGKSRVRRPGRGCVLVSTQVAEQSVDIDADLLITDLAPTDMLLQRLGRLWRHPGQRPIACAKPEVWVGSPLLDLAGLRDASSEGIAAAFGKSSRVYAPYVLLRTFVLWRDRTELTLPDDIRPLLEATYVEPVEQEPPSWSALRDALEARKAKLRCAAEAGANPWQLALEDEEGVQTRWASSPTASLLLVRRIVSWDTRKGAVLELLSGDPCVLGPGKFDFQAARAIHRNVVKVPRWSVRQHLGRAPEWLHDYVAGDLVACKVRGEELLVLPDGEISRLTYRGDLGVVIPLWQAEASRRRQAAEENDDESYDW